MMSTTAVLADTRIIPIRIAYKNPVLIIMHCYNYIRVNIKSVRNYRKLLFSHCVESIAIRFSYILNEAEFLLCSLQSESLDMR